jgi:outer membrane biogenesis lipoprotein LolB
MRRRALWPVALSLLCACPLRPAAPPPAWRADATVHAEDLLRAVETRRAHVRTLRALARTAYISPAERRRAKQVILAARPDRLRFEVLSPVGTVFVLAVGHGVLAAYARDEQTVYRGAASAANLQRYAAVELPAATAVDVLLGTPPLPRTAQNVVSRDGGLMQLWQADGADVHVTWFTPALDTARYEQRDADGHVRLRAVYGAYVGTDPARLPTRLRLELPAARQLAIELRDPELNPALADAAFVLETPPGSREVDLDQAVN